MPRARLITVTLLLFLTACTAYSGSSGTVAPPTAPPPTSEVRSLVLPFDRYRLSVNDIYLIEGAQDILTRDCMKRRGHDWELVNNHSTFIDLRNRRRYGVIEMPVAEELGYHTTPQLLGSTEVTARKQRRESRLSMAEQKDAFDPENGCYVRAGRQLAQGTQVDEGPMSDLSYRILNESRKSLPVSRALASWGRCMHGYGFSYRDPAGAGSDPAWHRSQNPSRKELATAVADVRCKRRADLVAVWHREEKGRQEQAVRLRSEYFGRLAAAKARHLDAARAVLFR
ncbi:hypothetical protein AB0I69_28550 [Streptomyces sp. NPDC050508]|uniref:hypothetical protein n=1 Tax=Streptomyces sp. NPDC050508 TaxID=3155405 RepID=UPI00343E165F